MSMVGNLLHSIFDALKPPRQQQPPLSDAVASHISDTARDRLLRSTSTVIATADRVCRMVGKENGHAP